MDEENFQCSFKFVYDLPLLGFSIRVLFGLGVILSYIYPNSTKIDIIEEQMQRVMETYVRQKRSFQC